MADFNFDDLNTKPEMDFSDLNSDNSSHPKLPESFIKRIPGAALTVGGDLLSAGLNIPSELHDAWNAIPGVYEKAKTEVPAMGKEALAHPLRSLASYGTGLAQSTAGGIAHGVEGMNRYLAKIGLIEPETAESINKTLLPHGVQLRPEYQKIIEENQPGDLGWRTAGQATPFISPAVSATKLATRLTGKTIGGIKDALSTGASRKAVESAESALQEAEKGLAGATESEGAVKQAAKTATKTADIGTLEGKINQANQDVEDLKGRLTTVPEGAQSPQEAQDLLDKAQFTHDSAKSNLAEIENSIDKHLEPEAPHDELLAQNILPRQKAVTSDIGSIYDDIEDSLANKSVQLPNDKSLSQLNQELGDLIKSNQAISPKANELLKQIDNYKDQKTVPAREYLSQFRTTRDMERDVRKKSFARGIPDDERLKLRDQANRLEEKVDHMGSILENSIGKEDATKLQGANKRWSTEVTPLYKNRLYRQIERTKTLPENIIKKLRGSGEGMPRLRDLIQSDPEALRHLVGERYAASPKKVLSPDARTQHYINQMPHLKNLIEQRNQTLQHIEDSKNALDQAKEREKKVSQTFDKQRALQDEHDKTQSELKTMKHHLAELQKSAAEKKISLAEKVKREKEVKKAKEEVARKEKALGKIKSVIGTAAAMSGINYGVRKIGSIFTND